MSAAYHQTTQRATMAMQTLFKDGLPNNCKIHWMQAEKQNLEKFAKAYEALLPNSIARDGEEVISENRKAA